MKKIFLLLLIAGAMFNCSDDGDAVIVEPETYIAFTITPTSNVIGISYTGSITNINWGDGSTMTNLQSKDDEYSPIVHAFAVLRKIQRVQIASGLLQSISLSNDDISQGSLSIGNCPILKSLAITFSATKLSDNTNVLNLTNCPSLTRFTCSNTQCSAIVFPYESKLEELNISTETKLVSLNLENQTNLKTLRVSDGKPTNIILPQNGFLENLSLTHISQLSKLNLNNNNVIKYLDVRNCSFAALDLTTLFMLTEFNCYQNNLTTIDVSQNQRLTNLNCAYNRLAELDISKNLKLTELNCSNNQLSKEALNKIFANLPASNTIPQPSISIGNNPGTIECNKSIAQSKGWEVWTGWE